MYIQIIDLIIDSWLKHKLCINYAISYKKYISVVCQGF